MSSVLQSTCPSAVMRWRKNAEHWSRQTKVPAALILAVIDQESDGNPTARRAEPTYHTTLINRPKSAQRLRLMAASVGLNTKQLVTSYGLMQPLFTLAYGYGARSICDLEDPDKNIRYCAAHLATLMAKHKGDIAKTAGAYNGAGSASKYAKDVVKLYNKYSAKLKKGA